jgi:UDP-glucose 4-epimerase
VVSPKTVLVTGGAGFIGSHLVDSLVNLGHRVLVVDDLSTGKLRNLAKGVSFYHTSVTHPAVEEIFQKEQPQVVFHLAAQISVSKSVREPVKDAEANVLGILRLLEASRRYGVEKFIYSSTGGALYGDPEDLPCNESHPIKPLSPYGLSKSVGEKYLDLYRRLYRLNYVALRYGNVYGPRQDSQGEAGVIAIFAGTMIEGKQPRIYGDGGQERDFVYVGDVVQANLLAIKEGVVGTYNIGTGNGTSVSHIYQVLSEILKFRRKPVYAPTRLGDVAQISLDATKARQEMGWEPMVSLREGLERTTEFFQELAKAPG